MDLLAIEPDANAIVMADREDHLLFGVAREFVVCVAECILRVGRFKVERLNEIDHPTRPFVPRKLLSVDCDRLSRAKLRLVGNKFAIEVAAVLRRLKLWKRPEDLPVIEVDIPFEGRRRRWLLGRN